MLPTLADKWSEVPGGSDMGDRRFTDELSEQTTSDLLAYWERQNDEGRELRGWWWRLYRDVFQGKKVLEIGSGMGFDAMYFASHGAAWTCCDIAPTNLLVIERIAAAKGLDIQTLPIRSIKSFEELPSDFEFVWCNGSLINLPFELAREESRAILSRLRPGGRWIELAYPRERWVREGSQPFSEWGKSTDGERTPWMEWYDIERLKLRLHPSRLETNLEYRFSSDNFIWMDATYTGFDSNVNLPQVVVTPPSEPITTPPNLWNWAWSMPFDDAPIDREAITAEIVCSIEFGSVGIAFERDNHFVSREIIADARTGSQLIYITTSNFGTDIKLTARNASAMGPSRFKIESITLRPML